MGMMPALPGAAPQGEFGGNSPMPGPNAPPPAPGPNAPASPALNVLNDINNISRSAKSIADNFPTTMPIIDQINQLVSQLQLKIVQAMPASNMPAPPV